MYINETDELWMLADLELLMAELQHKELIRLITNKYISFLFFFFFTFA
jgi:hypothetical protein